MGITEILRRIWLFSANETKNSESFSQQPTQLMVKLNSSLRHIIVTNVSPVGQSNNTIMPQDSSKEMQLEPDWQKKIRSLQDQVNYINATVFYASHTYLNSLLFYLLDKLKPNTYIKFLKQFD